MHAIADDRADAKFAHLSGSVRNDPVFIVEHDGKTPIGKDFLDEAFHRQQFFLGQNVLSKKSVAPRKPTIGDAMRAKQLERGSKAEKYSRQNPVAGDAASST